MPDAVISPKHARSLLTPPASRAAPWRSAVVGREAPRFPGWLRVLLAVPLTGKLAGANVLIVAAVVGAALATHSAGAGDARMVALLVGALLVGLVVNIVLVRVALRPIGQLEATADRIWHGDLAARVPCSSLADRDMARVGRTVNLLLDGLTGDRARMRRLATQVISAGDAERARIARELHDSTAQTLAALAFQVSAAARDSRDPELTERLATIRELTTGVMEEVRLLSHTVYPSVLDDLGLPAALRTLARQAAERDPSVAIDVDAPQSARPMSTTGAAVLYRVAQEAITNALRHAAPRSIHVRLTADEHAVVLEVVDDGCGFDVAEAERRRPDMGLFSMRERVALADGRFELSSGPRIGTRITAAIPLGARPIDGPAVMYGSAQRIRAATVKATRAHLPLAT